MLVNERSERRKLEAAAAQVTAAAQHHPPPPSQSSSSNYTAALASEKSARAAAEARCKELELSQRVLDTRLKVSESGASKLKEREILLQKTLRDLEAKTKAGEGNVRDIMRDTEHQLGVLRREVESAKEAAEASASQAATAKRELESARSELVAAAASVAAAKSNTVRLKEMKDACDKLQWELSRKAGEIERLKETITSLNKSAATKSETLAKVQRELEGAVSAKGEAEKDSSALKKTLAQVQDMATAHKVELCKVVRERECLRADLTASEECAADLRTRLSSVRLVEARVRQFAVKWKSKALAAEKDLAVEIFSGKWWQGKCKQIFKEMGVEKAHALSVLPDPDLVTSSGAKGEDDHGPVDDAFASVVAEFSKNQTLHISTVNLSASDVTAGFFDEVLDAAPIQGMPKLRSAIGPGELARLPAPPENSSPSLNAWYPSHGSTGEMSTNNSGITRSNTTDLTATVQQQMNGANTSGAPGGGINSVSLHSTSPPLPTSATTSMHKAIAGLLSATVFPASGGDTSSASIIPSPALLLESCGTGTGISPLQGFGATNAVVPLLGARKSTSQTCITHKPLQSSSDVNANPGSASHPNTTTLATPLPPSAPSSVASFNDLTCHVSPSTITTLPSTSTSTSSLPPQSEDAYFDDPLRLPYVSIQYIESDDVSCLKRLQSIVKLGCPVDQTRDLKTLLYCTASGKMKCVAFLMEQGVRYSDSDACMRVAALAVRYALESWTNIDSKKAREEMAWREKQGAILVAKGCPLLPTGETLESLASAAAAVAAPSATDSANPTTGDTASAVSTSTKSSSSLSCTPGPLASPNHPPAGAFRDEEESLAYLLRCGCDPNQDPVYRYDPERIRYTPSDLGAPVPVILGIREFTLDYRGSSGQRFTTWKVSAKQKVANDLWNVWKAALPNKAKSK